MSIRRCVAVCCLSAIALISGCEHRPKDISQAIIDLKSKDDDVREKAAIKLRELASYTDRPDEISPAVNPLQEALNDPNVNVRSAAALALGKIGAPAKDAVPILAKKLSDSSENVRINAAAAIYSIAEHHRTDIPCAEEVIKKLLAVVDDENQFVRAHAIHGLIALAPDKEEVLSKICLKLNDSDTGVRIEALNALAALGLKAKPYVPLVKKLLRDRSLTVRGKAEQTLRSIEGQQHKINMN